MKLSSIRAVKAASGTWMDLPVLPGVSVLVIASDDTDFRRGLQKALQPHHRLIRAGEEVHPATLDKITARCVAQHLLKGWKNLEGDEAGPDGKPLLLEYSPELALELAEDPENIRFFRAIEQQGNVLATLNAEEVARLGKS